MNITRKCQIALCAGLLWSGLALGQLTPDGNARFGIKAGINGSYLYSPDEDISDREGKIGFTTGLFAKVPMNTFVALQPELLFSMKGDEYRYADDARALRLNLNYAELPLGLHLSLFKVVDLHGGGYISYLINAKHKRVGGDGQVEGEAELNADDFNRVDYGWFAGAGVNLGNVGLSFRFNRGLNPIYHSEVFDLFGNVKNVNSTLALSIAF